MNRSRSLHFLAPYRLEVKEEKLPAPKTGEVLVRASLSAISPGTEMLVYRGEFPQDISTDSSIPELASQFSYPLKYGYCLVGDVLEIGKGVDQSWHGRRVFVFHPHQSLFLAHPSELIPVPEGLSDEQAVLLPNTETAVNFVMDGKPVIGERVLVLGQGIVGLLTTALLARFPVECLVTLDRYPLRRNASQQVGAHYNLDPQDEGLTGKVSEILPAGADLAYELSGSPQALDMAIGFTGFEGRVVMGSWYGTKRSNLDLGGRFHRSRIRLVSSQVSTLASEFSGRWTKERRFDVAWQMLKLIQTEHLITHRFHILEAERAYTLIDQHPEQTIQVILTYA
jgi:2-desacetyl-2-hydroxyethyl bacteriochlorophyllide A dehydrogenase